MSKLAPTYVRENGRVYAFFEGKIIADEPDFRKTEETATHYLEHVEKNRKDKEKESKQKTATHIVSPNGVKGEILSRYDGIWDKEVTVRFENGTFARLSAHADADYEYITEKTADAPETPIEALQQELNEPYSHDLESLEKRDAQLEDLVTQASSHLATKKDYYEEDQFDKLIMLANHERGEIADAIGHLKQADMESFIPDQVYSPTVVEQADLGPGAKENSWLDQTAQDMIDENATTDFEQFLHEEPSQLTAELETGTLADQGSTAQMAMSRVIERTAGFTGAEVEDYRSKFVEATEQARRIELAKRLENQREAAVEEDEGDFPDDALFI